MALTTEEQNKRLIQRAFEQGPFCEGGLSPGGGVLPTGSATADLYAATCVFHGAAELFVVRSHREITCKRSRISASRSST